MSLTELVERPLASTWSGRTALFDLDRTLIPGSSLVAVARALAADGELSTLRLAGAVLSNALFARRGAGQSRTDQVRDRVLAEVAGRPAQEMAELAQRVGAEVASRPFAGAAWLVRQHVDAGDRCVVLSASPHELVAVVAAALGAHHAVGTKAEVIEGAYTGRLDGPFCHGAGKLARLRDELGDLDLAASTAYADSLSDLPVLEACGQAVAVNPDRGLRAIATDRGWPQLRFDRPAGGRRPPGTA